MNASCILKKVATLALSAALLTGLGGSIVEAQASSDKPVAAKKSSSATSAIDINTASAAELESLPGVGPSRAKAIVQMRDHMKGFRRVEDLMRVKGIGRKTFKELSPLVTLGTAAKSAAAKSASPKSAANAKH